MTDYGETGAVPLDDDEVADLPTVDEVLERQAEDYPEQARTASRRSALTPEELAALEAGGTPVDDESDEVAIEGPNSA